MNKRFKLNMKKKKEFRLSKDLKTVMSETYAFAERNHRPVITVVDVVGRLLFPLITCRQNKETVLTRLLSKVPEKMKDNLLTFLEQSAQLQDLENIPEEFAIGGGIVTDEELSEVLEAALEFTNKSFPERLGEIDTDVFLFCVLSEGYSKFSDLLSDYISQEELEKIMFEYRKQAAEDYTDDLTSKVTDLLSSITGMDKKKLEEISKEAMKEAKKEIEEKKDTHEEDERNFEKYGNSKAFSGTEVDPNSDTPILDSFGVDYTKKAERKEFDTVIGRDSVVDSIIEILNKRKKNSVVITGPAGGGKSAIVERLAQRIIAGEVPERMKGIRLCALNINDLIAGTQYRGQFEERIQKIIKEVIEHKGEIIVFIDELHNIVNAGSSGSGDLANILKPYLARGEFQCIGATTVEEYHKYIEKDAALNRRFTQIEIEEPDVQETFKILKGIQSHYESYHHVRYTKAALELCVEWSDRYISDKNFPDKAIDVMDLAGSLAFLSNLTDENAELKAKIADLVKQKIQAVTQDMDFELGEKLKAEEEALRAQLERDEKTGDKRKNWPEVTKDYVAAAVSKVSRIPVDKINQTDNEKIALMKKELERRVIGQQEAIDTFTRAIQLNALGIRDKRKPICSVLAIGPSGVGKTLISEEVADIFFGSRNDLIKIDGGEFKEEHSLSKLIGAPAGYVGHGDFSSAIFNKVRQHKRSVVLFDEVEKFNPKILDVILSITDQGYCKMADGMLVDFTNCVLIFTGNIGTKELGTSLNIGFGSVSEEDQKNKDRGIVMKSVEKHFRPEFLGRLSSILIFNSLGDSELEKIFNIELDKLRRNLNRTRVGIKVNPDVRKFVIGKVDKRFGARDLQKNIIKYVVEPISDEMLRTPDATKFVITIEEDKPKVEAIQ